MVQILLEAGADPNIKAKYGRTPLMGATVGGSIRIVKVLLEAPTLDREATDNFGRTALMEAVARNRPRILELLSWPGEGRMMHPSTVSNELTNGVLSEYKDLSDYDVPPEYDHISCDVCRIDTSLYDAYHCLICHEGKFHICEECKKWGARSLYGTFKKILLGQVYEGDYGKRLEWNRIGYRK
ncbi:hypothetical protein ASPZODRAFT_136921 [Penicilliopsis zonata CBS 506.65]|uniref:Uncharacterized protein n=1 Tax=Penicilliopsis zonata CBS 506.65 TaxID=1073090 RepID=A0A1L9S6L1_9EURO|nr:hypothetical protein ASPZODRAFT_136921 [Penicilliopsis zonata CBS 506.65]OJJ42787.1 hypothetical protein ASPZODRAFT_136921 [Penicilliopsis zonata CBS 506.65]